MARNSANRSFQLVASGVLGVFLAGCVALPRQDDSAQAGSLVTKAGPAGSVEDLVLVDCLLPGEVRKLGAKVAFRAPRQRVKATRSDCQRQRGETILFDRSDGKAALTALQPRADGGDALAQMYLGEIYEGGLGLRAPDHRKAAEWYRKAAENGDASAQIRLGSLFDRGAGVPKDAAQALSWYRLGLGLMDDALLFEQTLKAQQDGFIREVALRNQVADALVQRLKAAATAQSKPAGEAKPNNAKAAVEPESGTLQRQLESQRLDAESQADFVRKEQRAIERIKKADGAGGQGAEAGQSARIGKLETTRNARLQALLDTARRLSSTQ